MSEQLDLFSEMPETLRPGSTTENRDDIGKPLQFKEAEEMIGQHIWFIRKMENMTYWELVKPEGITHVQYWRNIDGNFIRQESDRLVCYSGKSQRLLIDEYMDPNCFYALKEQENK